MPYKPDWFVRELKLICEDLDLKWNPVINRWLIIMKKPKEKGSPQGFRRYALKLGEKLYKIVPLDQVILILETKRGEYLQPCEQVLTLIRYFFNLSAQEEDKKLRELNTRSRETIEGIRKDEIGHLVKDACRAFDVLKFDLGRRASR